MLVAWLGQTRLVCWYMCVLVRSNQIGILVHVSYLVSSSQNRLICKLLIFVNTDHLCVGLLV